MKAGLRVAADRSQVLGSRIHTDLRHLRVLEELRGELGHERRPEPLSEPLTVGQELVDAEDAGTGLVGPPIRPFARPVELDVGLRSAVEVCQERMRGVGAPPLTEVGALESLVEERQIELGQRLEAEARLAHTDSGQRSGQSRCPRMIDR